MAIIPNFIPTVLIIDDEPFNLEFLEIVLQQQGYKTTTAENGKLGRQLATEIRPDIILLDVMMPGESGFECASMLRLSNETSEIPIIFLTALDDEKTSLKGYDLGAVDFITKPFEYNDVLLRLRLHLAKKYSDELFLKDQNSLIDNLIVREKFSPSQNIHKFNHHKELPPNYIYESVQITQGTNLHLLLNFTHAEITQRISNTLKKLLQLNSGPTFSIMETMRNIGWYLKNDLKIDTPIDGFLIKIEKETEKMSAINCGSIPIVFHQKEVSILIEPQSGNLGSLDKGLPPASTFTLRKKNRIFFCSKSLLEGFSYISEGVKELKEACELSIGVDIETACLATGEVISKNSTQNGTLFCIET